MRIVIKEKLNLFRNNNLLDHIIEKLKMIQIFNVIIIIIELIYSKEILMMILNLLKMMINILQDSQIIETHSVINSASENHSEILILIIIIILEKEKNINPQIKIYYSNNKRILKENHINIILLIN